MRSPQELDAVEWSALSHAYGQAGDVPLPIEALYLGDDEAATERITGDAARAVPVLAEIAGPTPVGLRALLAPAAIGEVPEDLGCQGWDIGCVTK